ncbi:T9SS type A sorting domain-containing protein [Flavobacterium terrisoli]|uniref:T9SS type A sorting domain-containing protein n=1 Tax=Flavobacterium terrisoli TaxID=3242195 RepID=UPI002542F12D|nr:T9SS type A sorting domain-containing protein [Flavobacterium buctense]
MTKNYQKTISLLALFVFVILSQFVSAHGTTFNAMTPPETTACSENSNEAQPGLGTFTTGYTATFETVGTDVIVTFELLDTDKTGVIAYLWRQTPFAETGMTNTTGLTFTTTLTGQTIGATITYACKFAYAGGLSVTKWFNYTVGNNCNGGGPDTEAPTNFTASVGTITGTSVQLLLNGTDNSGALIYDITYGAQSTSTSGASGVQKSLVINGLTPSTAYTFNVTARDAANNMAANNPIVLQATTTTSTNTACSGVSNEAQQGSFSTGYNYSFVTSGTDVTFTFEMLDTDKVGVIAYLWQQTPFGETPMTNIGGLAFSTTVTGLTVGTDVTYACKFAYAGGLVVTKWFTYNVGDTCQLGVSESELNSSIKLYPNPATSVLNIESSLLPITKVEFYSILGNKVLETSNIETINIENLSSGMYMVKMYAENNRFVTRKLVVE